MTGYVASPKGDSFDWLMWSALKTLMSDEAIICEPRGQKIREIIAPTLILTNPRNRLVSVKSREPNYGFSSGEFFWYWTGRQDLEMMTYYNKRMKDFSNDGKTLSSAYGHRMKVKTEKTGPWSPDGWVGETLTQWEGLKRTLIADPDSRRAVVIINEPRDNTMAAQWGSKDVPCTLSFQFFIRNGKLDMHAHMRSNDIIWGLTSDLFSFTLFQECLLLELQKEDKFKDLELGTYYHTAGSLHIYERHFEQAKRMISEYDSGDWVMEKMGSLTSLDELDCLVLDEQSLRDGLIKGIHAPKFEGSCRWMAQHLNAHRSKRDAERVQPVQ